MREFSNISVEFIINDCLILPISDCNCIISIVLITTWVVNAEISEVLVSIWVVSDEISEVLVSTWVVNSLIFLVFNIVFF